MLKKETLNIGPGITLYADDAGNVSWDSALSNIDDKFVKLIVAKRLEELKRKVSNYEKFARLLNKEEYS